MKKIFNLSLITLLAGFIAVSCDRNDEDEIQNVEAIKIDSVKIAQDTMDVFNFRPEEKGIYTFKFWNGKDSSNQNIWIEKTIVVE